MKILRRTKTSTLSTDVPSVERLESRQLLSFQYHEFTADYAVTSDWRGLPVATGTFTSLERDTLVVGSVDGPRLTLFSHSYGRPPQAIEQADPSLIAAAARIPIGEELRLMSRDVNGDGYDDLLVSTTRSHSRYPSFDVLMGGTTPFAKRLTFDMSTLGAVSVGDRGQMSLTDAHFIDINKDSRSDIVLLWQTSYDNGFGYTQFYKYASVLLATPAWNEQSLAIDSSTHTESSTLSIDYSGGDAHWLGRLDPSHEHISLIYQSGFSLQLVEIDANGTMPPTAQDTIFVGREYDQWFPVFRLLDFTGDGRVDILYLPEAGSPSGNYTGDRAAYDDRFYVHVQGTSGSFTGRPHGQAYPYDRLDLGPGAIAFSGSRGYAFRGGYSTGYDGNYLRQEHTHVLDANNDGFEDFITLGWSGRSRLQIDDGGVDWIEAIDGMTPGIFVVLGRSLDTSRGDTIHELTNIAQFFALSSELSAVQWAYSEIEGFADLRADGVPDLIIAAPREGRDPWDDARTLRVFAGSSRISTPGKVSGAAGHDGRITIVQRSGPDAILITQDGSEGIWSRVSLDHIGIDGSFITDLVTWTDPKDGHTYFAGSTADRFYILRHDSGRIFAAGGANLSTLGLLTSSLTTFIVNNRVSIAGLLPNGDLAVYSQNGSKDASGNWSWTYTNVFDEHLRPLGQFTPTFVGGLTSYVTAWGARNIVGLDRHGRIWTIWQAPGKTRWVSSNLSLITGAPSLSGSLAVYMTPWSGINIAGVDKQGNLQVTWWIPKFKGVWAVSNMTARSGGGALVPGSITSWVTSWNALNIAGIDKAGKVVTYWWVPAFASSRENNRWRLTDLTSTFVDQQNKPVAHLSSFTSRSDQRMVITGVSQTSDPVVLWWTPQRKWNADRPVPQSLPAFAAFEMMRVEAVPGATSARVRFASDDGVVVLVDAVPGRDGEFYAPVPPAPARPDGRGSEVAWNVRVVDPSNGKSVLASTPRIATPRVSLPTQLPPGQIARDLLTATVASLDRTLSQLSSSDAAQVNLKDRVESMQTVARKLLQDVQDAMVRKPVNALRTSDGRTLQIQPRDLEAMDQMLYSALASEAARFGGSTGATSLYSALSGSDLALTASASRDYIDGLVMRGFTSADANTLVSSTRQASAVVGGVATAAAVLALGAGGAVAGSAVLASVGAVATTLLATGAVAAGVVALHAYATGDTRALDAAKQAAEHLLGDFVKDVIVGKTGDLFTATGIAAGYGWAPALVDASQATAGAMTAVDVFTPSSPSSDADRIRSFEALRDSVHYGLASRPDILNEPNRWLAYFTRIFYADSGDHDSLVRRDLQLMRENALDMEGIANRSKFKSDFNGVLASVLTTLAQDTERVSSHVLALTEYSESISDLSSRYDYYVNEVKPWTDFVVEIAALIEIYQDMQL
jgi:hypothetical protein